ncbi:MAG: DNA/RNA non-specific endonuclease [Tenericutes bacterium]|nr:DNA/RNA non-specific endonuclease [Mycoplasmatota bacterium]
MEIKNQLQNHAIGRFTNNRTKTWILSPDITLSGDKITHKNKTDFGTIDEINRVITIDRRLALESKGRRNPLLSHTALVPNCTYKITDADNVHWFMTDEQGRTIKTKHWVKDIYRQRLNDEQTKALMCKDEDTKPNTPREINDEGGHILADSAGGLPESINIFPQAYRVNHSKEWRGLETQIKNAILNGDNVHVETEFRYNDACKRPENYTYYLTVNGSQSRHAFDNRNLTLDELKI